MKVIDRVLKLVTLFPELSDNYNRLVIHYWAHYDNVTNFSDVATATSAESITRALRKLVSDKLITLKPATAEHRGRVAKAVHMHYAKGHNPNQLTLDLEEVKA
jgi:predicted MarR family transcription regulator